jgi:hypothetical protein
VDPVAEEIVSQALTWDVPGGWALMIRDVVVEAVTFTEDLAVVHLISTVRASRAEGVGRIAVVVRRTEPIVDIRLGVQHRTLSEVADLGDFMRRVGEAAERLKQIGLQHGISGARAGVIIQEVLRHITWARKLRILNKRR